jgi:hypothetical protein
MEFRRHQILIKGDPIMKKLIPLSLFTALPLAFAAVPSVAGDSVGQMEAQTCSGAAKTINATGSYIRVRGYCSTLTVNGDGNMVMLDRAGSITVNGAGNQVSYKDLNPPAKKGGKMWHPKIAAKGMGNLVNWSQGKEIGLGDASGESDDD